MKPILYAATETDFITQGLGTLYDAMTCKVTEVRNGQYELAMTYPVTGQHFSDIKHSRIIVAKPSDSGDPQPFRIYSITKPINGRVTVRAEHISYQMSHIPVKPFTSGSVAGTLSALSQNAFETCPFTFWTDKTTTAQFKLKEPASMRSILGGIQGSILDVYGGEWEFDVWDAKLHNNRGADNGVTLRYGKNITDLTQEENIANTYTGIVPFWSGQTDDGEDQVVVTDQPVYAQNANLYPYHRTKVVDFSGEFESAPTKAQLTTAANSYITANNIGIPAVSLKVSFVALWQSEEYKDIANVERINLCDTVTVEFPLLGVSVKAKVIQTVWDVLADRYESIEIGEARSTLASTITDTATKVADKATESVPTMSYMQRAISHASQMITGGLGGYVYIKPNANGNPEEILIMDNPDYLQAQKLWRWNKNGLGHSSTGYNGSYSTAITADGHINANFIDTGILTADIIKGGVLQDLSQNFTLNLASGSLSSKKLEIDSPKFKLSNDGIMSLMYETRWQDESSIYYTDTYTIRHVQDTFSFYRERKNESTGVVTNDYIGEVSNDVHLGEDNIWLHTINYDAGIWIGYSDFYGEDLIRIMAPNLYIEDANGIEYQGATGTGTNVQVVNGIVVSVW